MGVSEVTDELNDVLCRQPVPQDEVLTVIGTAFHLARTTGDREVVYFASDGQPAIRLTYTRKGNITAQADTGLDDELASLILTRARTLISATDPVVWRQVWFSSLPLNGYWRYRDEWQIAPVPEDAPKPEFLMAENPFLIEVRGMSTGDSHVDDLRARRRLRELQLILSLALRVSISNNDRSPPHAWVLADLTTEPRSEYRQRGYVIPNLTAPRMTSPRLSDSTPFRRSTMTNTSILGRVRVTFRSTFLRSCHRYSTATRQPLQPIETPSFAPAIG